MKSVALYYGETEKAEEQNHNNSSSHRHTTENSEFGELHINLWKVGFHKFYIDFGIKAPFSYKKFNLYLPFKIDESIEDLNELLASERGLLSAIFNEELKEIDCPNENYLAIRKKDDVLPLGENVQKDSVTPNPPKNQNKKAEFYLYNISNENYSIEYTKKEDGTSILLTMKGNPSGNEQEYENYTNEFRYIRFRVQVTSSIAKSQSISNDLIQSAFSSADLFDIRINECREIPNKIKETMREKDMTLMKFSKVHFFYITNTSENIENGSAIKTDSRIIENDHWEKYIPERSKSENTPFIAHHWKTKTNKDKKAEGNNLSVRPSVNSFSIFFSTKYPQLRKYRIITYISTLILFGFLGSFIANNIHEFNNQALQKIDQNEWFHIFQNFCIKCAVVKDWFCGNWALILVCIFSFILIVYTVYHNFSFTIKITRKR